MANSAPTPVDADLEIRVKKFVEYVNATAFCPYTITPFASHGSPPAKPGKDSHGQPMWKFGDRVSLHVGHYQKPETYQTTPPTPTTVRLEAPNKQGVLRYRVVVEDALPGAYYPIGLAFKRADESEPVGARFTTGNVSPGQKGNPANNNTPFGNVKLNETENVVEYEMVEVAKLNSKKHIDQTGNAIGGGVMEGSHRTYRFMIIIQEAATGKIGVIDPENETPNNTSGG